MDGVGIGTRRLRFSLLADTVRLINSHIIIYNGDGDMFTPVSFFISSMSVVAIMTTFG